MRNSRYELVKCSMPDDWEFKSRHLKHIRQMLWSGLCSTCKEESQVTNDDTTAVAVDKMLFTHCGAEFTLDRIEEE